MKEIKIYRCEVDLYRNGMVFRNNTNRLYDRGTTGVYAVAAKSAKEATKLLRKTIGFGSIMCTEDETHNKYIREKLHDMRYKEIRKITGDCTVRHATAPVN